MSWKDPCNKYFARTPVNEISVSAWFKEVTADLSLEDVVASTAADWYSRFNAHRPAGVKSDQEFKVLKSLWTDRDDALAAVRQSSAISLTTIAAKHDRLKDCISSRNKRKNEEEGVMAQHEKRTRLPVPSQATDDTSRVKPHDGTSQIPGKRTEVEMLPSSHPVHSEMVESQSAMSKELREHLAQCPFFLKQHHNLLPNYGLPEVDAGCFDHSDASVESTDFVEPPPTPTAVPGLQDSLEEIEKIHRECDATCPMFWNVLDMRRPNEDREIFDATKQKILRHVAKVGDGLSPSVVAYFTAIERMVGQLHIQLLISDLANTADATGVKGFKDDLRKRVEARECEVKAFCNGQLPPTVQTSMSEIKSELEKVDAFDTDTQWANRLWRHLNNGIKSRAHLAGEGTVDAYMLAPFYIKPPMVTLFGEKGSIAHLEDQVARGGTPGKSGDSRGKKCDFMIVEPKDEHWSVTVMRSILLVRTRRVSNEIHRIGLENLLDGCRVARAQYQRICNDIGCDTQHVENFILRELGVRFTQVISEEIVFRYLVAITSELFAFADVGIANIPTTDHEVQRGVHMARMFLLYHGLALQASSTKEAAKRLVLDSQEHLDDTNSETAFLQKNTFIPLDIPYYLDVALQVERPPITPCKKAAGSLVY